MDMFPFNLSLINANSDGKNSEVINLMKVR